MDYMQQKLQLYQIKLIFEFIRFEINSKVATII